MVSLKMQKRLAASVLECGKRKVWLDPNEANELSMANSSEFCSSRLPMDAATSSLVTLLISIQLSAVLCANSSQFHASSRASWTSVSPGASTAHRHSGVPPCEAAAVGMNAVTLLLQQSTYILFVRFGAGLAWQSLIVWGSVVCAGILIGSRTYLQLQGRTCASSSKMVL